jgi:hypothetical protein
MRILHCLGNRLIDGGVLVSLKHWLRSTPQRYYCYTLVIIYVRSRLRLEGLGKFK